jgi:trk system potassium uptake protein TrkA
MRIFIAGAGEVGTHLAKLFVKANHDVTLMDENEEKLKQIDSHFDLMTRVGVMTSIEDLKEANVGSSDLFIAVPPYPDMSILASILAKKLGAKMTVSRVNNHEYLLRENLEFFKQLGVDELIYPEHLGAMEVIESIKQVGIRQIFEFSQANLVLLAIKLRDNAPIIDKTLLEVSAMHDRKYNTVAIYRDSETIIPHGGHSFMHNDLVYFVTTRENIPQVMNDCGKEQFNINNIMILGGSRIGKRVALELEHRYNIKLIEINKDKASKIADFLESTLVINGDGRNLELLRDEGIQKMDAFIAVTDNSEVNILACQLAKKMGVKKTVAEVENIDYIPLAENIGIGTLINKKLLAASHIYKFTLKAHVQYVKCLTFTDAEVLELVAQPGSKVVKETLKNLSLPKDVNIGGIIRGDQAVIVNGNSMIMPYDKVIVFALPSGIPKIEKMFS